MKKRLAEQEAITEKEGKGFYVGDALLMAIGQGLNAVTPLQLTNAYASYRQRWPRDEAADRARRSSSRACPTAILGLR